jgi:hypothetical protein
MPKSPDKTTLKNKRFGKLVTIEKINKKDVRGRPRVYWRCRCDCGTYKEIRQEVLGTRTNSCGCNAFPPSVNSSDHHFWSGYEEISGTYLADIRRKAEDAGRVFAVSPEFLWALYLKQNRRCRLSGLPIRFSAGRKERGSQTASLDRIDSSKNYTEDNVQWVHKKINIMKNVFPQDEFIEMCRLVTSNQKRLRSKSEQPPETEVA